MVYFYGTIYEDGDKKDSINKYLWWEDITLFVFLENLETLKFQDSVYQLRRSGSQGGCAILTVCILPYHPDFHIPF